MKCWPRNAVLHCSVEARGRSDAPFRVPFGLGFQPQMYLEMVDTTMIPPNGIWREHDDYDDWTLAFFLGFSLHFHTKPVGFVLWIPASRSVGRACERLSARCCQKLTTYWEYWELPLRTCGTPCMWHVIISPCPIQELWLMMWNCFFFFANNEAIVKWAINNTSVDCRGLC